jgi:opacity protein-like surface antigen
MIKNILTITVCAMMLSLSSIAYSAEGRYVSYNVGVVIPSDSDVTDSTIPGITLDIESDTGWAIGMAVGYDLGNNIRIEGAIAYAKNSLDKASLLGTSVDLTGDTSNFSFLVNGYYDFPNKSKTTPFISAGVGLARVEINDMNVPGSGAPSVSDDDNVLAYQIGAGIGYAITKDLNLDLKYFYFGTEDPEFDTTTIEYSGHNVYAGIRIAF